LMSTGRILEAPEALQPMTMAEPIPPSPKTTQVEPGVTCKPRGEASVRYLKLTVRKEKNPFDFISDGRNSLTTWFQVCCCVASHWKCTEVHPYLCCVKHSSKACRHLTAHDTDFIHRSGIIDFPHCDFMYHGVVYSVNVLVP
jgi:hypothetical protein